MASLTEISQKKRKRRRRNMGHARKVKQAKASTLSAEALFAACGEPGKPAPADDKK